MERSRRRATRAASVSAATARARGPASAWTTFGRARNRATSVFPVPHAITTWPRSRCLEPRQRCRAPPRAGEDVASSASTAAGRSSASDARPGRSKRGEVGTEQRPDGLLLPVQCPSGGRSEMVGRRDQQPIGELSPRRLAQERVEVGLLDRVGRVVVLRLDRPQPAVAILGDEVDPCVILPPLPGHSAHSHTRPSRAAYSGRVLQHPLRQPLEPTSRQRVLLLESGKKVGELGHVLTLEPGTWS